MNKDLPREWIEALESLRGVKLPDLVTLEEVPAPTRIAPYAAALSLQMEPLDPDDPTAHGRFVVLHDPAGQAGWQGTFRLVWSIHSPIDPDIIGDQSGSELLWAWVREALIQHGAGFDHLVGSVTAITSRSFGGLHLHGTQSQVEVRASLTPTSADISPHLRALAQVLGLCAGYAPTEITPLAAVGVGAR